MAQGVHYMIYFVQATDDHIFAISIKDGVVTYTNEYGCQGRVETSHFFTLINRSRAEWRKAISGRTN